MPPAEPEIEMNPVLLKPEGDSRSQVVLMGRPWKTLSAGEYYTCREVLWSSVVSSFEKLAAENDLVLVEGAGSPAEINLRKSEIVNMRVAKTFGCPVLLAGDIDRGGVFASLVGTLALLEEDERALVKGFLINKFRGDVKLLEPGLEMLTDLTGGRPVLGVIPWLKNLAVAQEDSVYLDENRGVAEKGDVDIAVIKLPRISNYDDFDPLALEDGVGLRFVDDPASLGHPDALILPGSKTTIGDLAWLRRTGFDGLIGALALAGSTVAGICGGYQMLGRRIIDADGVEGSPSEVSGLGLLPGETVFEPAKETSRVSGVTVPGPGFPGDFPSRGGVRDPHGENSASRRCASPGQTQAAGPTGPFPRRSMGDVSSRHIRQFFLPGAHGSAPWGGRGRTPPRHLQKRGKRPLIVLPTKWRLPWTWQHSKGSSACEELYFVRARDMRRAVPGFPGRDPLPGLVPSGPDGQAQDHGDTVRGSGLPAGHEQDETGARTGP